MKISFCLITLNEEANLRRCLQSCAGLADEIVVVDCGSSDGTEAIAREFGARWVRQDWLGFVGQKNRALELAVHPWVLSIDTDEEISPALSQEIVRIKQTGAPEDVSGYSMPRCVLYDGRWIRHGDWYPDRLLRLFRKQGARFAGGKVHERLELVGGRVESLRGDLFHYSFKDADDHWARCQKYARLWAETQHEASRTCGPIAPWSHAAFRWLRGYILRGGFLDGPQGWRIAALCAKEVFLKYQLLREMHRVGVLKRE